MTIINIINEEINTYYEGVGDKYAERRFNIPNQDDEFEKEYQQKLKKDNPSPENGKLVATVEDRTSHEFVNIYKNPKSLKNFGENVRGISDNNGNLYLAQFDKRFLHSDIGNALKIDLKNTNEFISWLRLRTNDIFITSYTFVESLKGMNDESFKIVQQRIEKINNIYPFKFMLTGKNK